MSTGAQVFSSIIQAGRSQSRVGELLAWQALGNFYAMNIIQENNAVTIMWRQALGPRLILQADVVDVTWASAEHINADQEVDSGSYATSDVIFDTLQNDDRWTVDEIGYNVLIEVPPGAFPEALLYEIETSLNLVGSSPLVTAFPIPVTHRPELV